MIEKNKFRTDFDIFICKILPRDDYKNFWKRNTVDFKTHETKTIMKTYPLKPL